jgi:SAM-dependent methyltransferase
MTDDIPGLPERSFDKEDDAPDTLFYATPRLVKHIDEGAIAAVTGLYRELLPAGGVILDLMGSWVSHLPPEITYAEVIGHGMNETELTANQRYTRWFIQDLNQKTRLPLAGESVDAVAICVSIQYLQQPVAVLSEVREILKPGGVVIITFSNRCFPTKAVLIWQALEMGHHQQLVSLYLEQAGFTDVDARTVIPQGLDQDPLWAVIARK